MGGSGTSHLFIHLENWIGGCWRTAEHARGLAAPSEALRGLAAAVAHLRQIVVAHVVHPLLAFGQPLPLVPFHEFDGTVVTDADASVRPDGKEVRRRRAS